MIQPMIELDTIEFSYGRLQVLFGISFAVAPGEAVALLGTNGAGKSTLLRLLSGLDRPSAGRVFLDGRDITGQPAEHIVSAGLALIPGGKAVFPDLTVRENLEIQAVPIHRDRANTRARVARVLETFPGIAGRLDARAGTLSGGQQQQLGLAKALLLEPRVLCIDELSLGLAPVVVQQLIGLVAALKDAGMTLMVVEQSLNVAAQLCDRAVFVEKGQVRFDGRTADLLERDEVARAVFLGGAGPDDRPGNGSGARRRRATRP